MLHRGYDKVLISGVVALTLSPVMCTKLLREEKRLEALVDSLLRSTQLDAGGLVVERSEWPLAITPGRARRGGGV